MPRTYPFSVQVTDDIGATATRSFSIDVNNSDFDRFAYVNQNGIGRSKDGENWQFDLSATNKGDFIFWCRDRWILVDGVDSVQVIKQSFDLRSWETLTLSYANLPTYDGYGLSFLYYCPADDTLYVTVNSGGSWLIAKLVSFSTFSGTVLAPSFFQSGGPTYGGGRPIDLTINPATNIAFVTLDNLNVITVNASETTTTNTGVNGRVWYSNGVLLAFNTRNSALFQVSFDDGLTFIDKSPAPAALADTITNYVYVNGVFTLMYRDSGGVTRLEYTTNLGDTWTNGSTSGDYNTSVGGVCVSLAYNGRRINIDNAGEVRVFTGNTSNTYAGTASLGQIVGALGESGNFAAVRIEAL